MSNKTKSPLSSATQVAGLSLPMGGGKSGDKLAPAPVYLLADHLDAVLASGEDLTRARIVWDMSGREDMAEILHQRTDVRAEIESIRAFENAIIARVLKSRDRVTEVMRADKRFTALGKLYLAGTAVLLDAVEECGDCTAIDFDTADSIPAYLRSRGLFAADAPAPSDGDTLLVSDKFLIAKRIAVGPLMDLAGTFLDSLETHFDLFLDEDELPLPPLVDRSDALTTEASASEPMTTATDAAALFAAQMADVHATLSEVDGNDDPLPRFMTSGDEEPKSETAEDFELVAEPEVETAEHEVTPDHTLSVAPEDDILGEDMTAGDVDVVDIDTEEADILEAMEADEGDDASEDTADVEQGDLEARDTNSETVDQDEFEEAPEQSLSDDADGNETQLESDEDELLSIAEIDDDSAETDITDEPDQNAEDFSATNEGQDDENVSAAEDFDASDAEDDIELDDDIEGSQPLVAAEDETSDLEADAETSDVIETDDDSDTATDEGDGAENTLEASDTVDHDGPKPKSLIRRLRLVK